jgi:hypothetical protein
MVDSPVPKERSVEADPKGKEVSSDEKAHIGAGDGAHDGAVDGALQCGVRGDHDDPDQRWRQHAERERERCSDRIVEPCGPPAARAEPVKGSFSRLGLVG